MTQSVTVLYTQAQITRRVYEVADLIAQDFTRYFITVPILTGGFILGADLIRALTEKGCDPLVDFLHLTSYGDAQKSSGIVNILKDFSQPIEGKDVLLVDDVLDSGRSLALAREMAIAKGARSTRTCVTVDKKTIDPQRVKPDYALFECASNAFLIGYGMDDKGKSRGLPFIGHKSAFTKA